MTLERPKPVQTVAIQSQFNNVVTTTLEVPTRKDEPMHSRNSPTTLNVLSYTDQEDAVANDPFSNR